MNSLANNNKLSTEDEEIHSARKRGYNEEQNYSEARKSKEIKACCHKRAMTEILTLLC